MEKWETFTARKSKVPRFEFQGFSPFYPSYTIQRQESVTDKAMLQSSDLPGLVKWMGLEAKEPKGGRAEHPVWSLSIALDLLR